MAKVKIQGNASGTGILTVTAPNTSTDRTITLPDATGTLLTADGDGSSLTGVGVDGISSSADATAITIDSSERVGVGTASPTEKLQVHGAIRSTNNATTTLADSGNFYYIPTADDASNPRTVISAVGTSSVGGHVTFKTGTSSSNTEKLRIQSGGGISFNGDTSAANALDDYEEGAWSPVLTGSNNTSHNTGRYTKIGKQVIIEGDFRCTSYSNSGSTAVTITGMPYAVANISNYNVTGSIYAVNGFNQANDHGYIIYAGANSTTILIYGQNQSTGVNYDSLKRSEMTSGIVEVFFTIHYQTD